MDENNVASYLEVQDDSFLSGKLSALYTFAVVSQYKSIRAAAQDLYISPQALNKQIAALEKKLGLPLIHRSPRGFVLTGYGEHVQKYAAGLMQDMQQLRRDLTAMYAEDNHLLRLAYCYDLYDTSLYMHMMDFQGEEPRCKISTRRSSFDKTMEIANGSEPYVTVATRPDDTEKFEITVLHDAKYYLLVRKDHPLSTLQRFDVNDLDGTVLILCAEFSRANQYLLKYCTEEKISATIHLETDGIQAGLESCRQNKGVMLMTDYIDEQFDTEEFARVEPREGLFFLELVMLVRKDLEYSAMEHKFIEYMKAYAPQLNKTKSA